MYNTLAELKTQEFENVEKTYNDISSKLRDIGEIRFYKVFGVTYLAYLAKVNKLETAKELSDYVAEQLPIEQGLFLKESVNNSWSMVISVGHILQQHFWQLYYGCSHPMERQRVRAEHQIVL